MGDDMNEFKKLCGDVKAFFVGVATTFTKLAKVYSLIQNNGTKALVLTLFADFLEVVKESGEAISEKGLDFTVDAAVVAGVKKLIADAKAGDATVIADLQALGFDLPTAVPVPAPVPAADLSTLIPA
jgi:hypothetical protein